PQTLAIVDEIGGGTEPNAGSALAVAMLERLLQRGAKAIVSTHSTELKLFAHATQGIANASVRFDPVTFEPSFELDLGAPGQSLAFPLATRMGIDGDIVGRATALLEDRERDYEAALAELAVRNAELREERTTLEAERRTAERETAAVRERERQLDEERRRLAAAAEERLQKSLRDFVGELQRRSEANDATRSRRARVTPGQSALLRETIAAVRKDLGITRQEERQGAPQTFTPGDRVRVVSLDQPATVAEDWDDRLLVSVGSMKMMVDRSDVRPEDAPRKRQRGGGAPADARVSAAVRTSESLDVRGKRYSEAEPLVERWIDDALLGGTPALRLIHGKGTGMLGRGLQEYLRNHPAVSAFRYGNEEEGSTGVTIVELRT
ncbi:MAG: Smr/MutS family protein, partial [Candidatus Eremiobacteraeota bacterium]|nr:Smr/MutS family protein [Candidatus Eremiobacteraeota bacterium]